MKLNLKSSHIDIISDGRIVTPRTIDQLCLFDYTIDGLSFCLTQSPYPNYTTTATWRQNKRKFDNFRPAYHLFVLAVGELLFSSVVPLELKETNTHLISGRSKRSAELDTEQLINAL